MVLNGGKGFNRAGSIDGGGGNISQRQYHHPSGERDAEPAEARPGSGRDGDLGRQVGQREEVFMRWDEGWSGIDTVTPYCTIFDSRWML